ncbi:MAG: hypothetical protein ACW7DO_13560, partial [Paraglaciecola chathamensis]
AFFGKRFFLITANQSAVRQIAGCRHWILNAISFTKTAFYSDYSLNISYSITRINSGDNKGRNKAILYLRPV